MSPHNCPRGGCHGVTAMSRLISDVSDVTNETMIARDMQKVYYATTANKSFNINDTTTLIVSDDFYIISKCS